MSEMTRIFCGCIYYLEAMVMEEGWADAESLVATESQDLQVVTLLWMMTGHPMGPSGVAS